MQPDVQPAVQPPDDRGGQKRSNLKAVAQVPEHKAWAKVGPAAGCVQRLERCTAGCCTPARALPRTFFSGNLHISYDKEIDVSLKNDSKSAENVLFVSFHQELLEGVFLKRTARSRLVAFQTYMT